MRFKDIECFNRAMLAKQGWRMMQESYSLIACIYKDKYFKNSQLLEAMLGNSPSLIRRSTWFLRDVLNDGLRWRVENGQNIKIWGHKWLPMPTTHIVQSPIRILNVESKVCESIDDVRKEWKEDVVKEVFHLEETMQICTIPIS